MAAKEANVRRYEFQKDGDENRCLFLYHPENIGVSFKSISEMQCGAVQSRGKGRKLRTWTVHAKQLDEKIEQVERELLIARRDFKESFGIEVEEASAEIERIREKIRETEHAINIRNARISEIEELQEAIELEYKTQLLLIDLLPDKEKMYQLLEELKEAAKNTYDKQLCDETKSLLNRVPDEAFKKIIANMPAEHVQVLIRACMTKEKFDLWYE